MVVKHCEIPITWQDDKGVCFKDNLVCPVSGITFQTYYDQPNRLDVIVDLSGLEEDIKLGRNVKEATILNNKLTVNLLLGR